MWVMWNLVLVYLEIVLVSVQDRCTVCAEHTIDSEIVWTHTMELLRDLGHVESCFYLFAGSANLDARLVQGLCRTYDRLGNYFGRTRWNS
jgi:hypothetical protein